MPVPFDPFPASFHFSMKSSENPFLNSQEEPFRLSPLDKLVFTYRTDSVIIIEEDPLREVLDFSLVSRSEKGLLSLIFKFLLFLFSHTKSSSFGSPPSLPASPISW